jgi:retinol-binding protein 3
MSMSAVVTPRVLLPALVLILTSPVARGQNATAPPDITLDATARAEIIDGAIKALNEGYVFPEVAGKMEQAIRARQQRKEYDSVTSGQQLAQMLTEHLREVSHDKHLRVNYSAQVLPPQPPAPAAGAPPSADAQAQMERQRTIASRQNFGFVRVERLAGNIGYVDLRGFMPPAIAGETATAAMNFLASTEAVIFDMRQNGGGDPSMVAFITSYLFGPQPVHLNDFYFRPTNETRPSYTLPYVPGRRLTGKDVYVLTSSRTFSGAEEFTYNLKNLKRATIVGETTGGGAHLVAGRRINDHFAIGVPSGRPINAVTKTDWEGVGVEPDVKVAADNALKTAHLLALEKQEGTLPADAPGLRNEVTATIESLRKELATTPTSGANTIETMKPTPASSGSEDFESGTLANWKVERTGAGNWFTYTNGKTAPDPAQSDPNIPFDVPNPPQGKFAAVTDMNGPGRRILYRDITLDGRYRLHLTVFYVNAGGFSASDTSSRDTLGDEQQYRIDLVSPAAPTTSTAKGELLAAIYQGRSGDPSRQQPTKVTFDLSPWAGQTVRLRLASADNQGPLRAGVDDIRFERIGQ